MGARAFITAALAGAILVSIAPASSIAADEPTPVVEPEAPVVDPVPPIPAADPAPVVEPTPADDPAPAPVPPVDVANVVVPPVVKRPKATEAQQIIRIARRQLGDPWRHAARGPRSFDCSGLVIYAFKKAGDSRAVGRGRLASARALYHWYRARGLASRHHPKVGDLVIWGGGTHVGIYIGKGKAISTLTSGVKIHRVHAVTARFTAYLHTGMWKKASS
jgi:cell wall-associated NlpC family hydrolase